MLYRWLKDPEDMIIASGFKVWPREVEDTLYQHPGVREAAVIGVPDEYRGETVPLELRLNETVIVGVGQIPMDAHVRLLLNNG